MSVVTFGSTTCTAGLVNKRAITESQGNCVDTVLVHYPHATNSFLCSA